MSSFLILNFDSFENPQSYTTGELMNVWCIFAVGWSNYLLIHTCFAQYLYYYSVDKYRAFKVYFKEVPPGDIRDISKISVNSEEPEEQLHLLSSSGSGPDSAPKPGKEQPSSSLFIRMVYAGVLKTGLIKASRNQKHLEKTLNFYDDVIGCVVTYLSALILYIVVFISYTLLIVFYPPTGYDIAPKKLRRYADVCGILSSICGILHLNPQIILTLFVGRSGSYSVPMLVLSTGGDFVYMIVLIFAGQSFVVWMSQLVIIAEEVILTLEIFSFWLARKVCGCDCWKQWNAFVEDRKKSIRVNSYDRSMSLDRGYKGLSIFRTKKNSDEESEKSTEKVE